MNSEPLEAFIRPQEGGYGLVGRALALLSMHASLSSGLSTYTSGMLTESGRGLQVQHSTSGRWRQEDLKLKAGPRATQNPAKKKSIVE